MISPCNRRRYDLPVISPCDRRRYDLDDVTGEVLLLRWGETPNPRRDDTTKLGTRFAERGACGHHVMSGEAEIDAIEVFRYEAEGGA